MKVHHDIPPALSYDVANHLAALFVGAGMSYEAGVPTSTMLAKKLERDLHRSSTSSPALKEIAQAYQDQPGLGRIKLLERVKELLSDAMPSPTHHYIPRFEWARIFTLNYDRLIEQSYLIYHMELVLALHDGSQVLKKSPVGLHPPLPLLRDAEVQSSLSDPTNLLLYKLHGCLSQIHAQDASPVLSSSDYDHALANFSPAFTEALLYSLRHHTLIVIGAGLHEDHLERIFKGVKPPAGPKKFHYIVNRNVDDIAFWESLGFEEAIEMDAATFFYKLYHKVEERNSKL